MPLDLLFGKASMVLWDWHIGTFPPWNRTMVPSETTFLSQFCWLMRDSLFLSRAKSVSSLRLTGR